MKKEQIINSNSSMKSEIIIKWLIFGFLVLSFFESFLIGSFGAYTRYYIIILIGAILLLTKKINFKWYHALYLLWFILKLVSLYWTPNDYIAKLHLFSHIGMTMLLIISTVVYYKEETISFFYKSLWLISGFMGILMLFFRRPYHNIVETRQVLYLFGQEMDPNNQAAFLAIGIVISLFYLFNKKHIFFSLIIMIINLYTILLTGSRGGLVSIFIAALFMILSMKSTKGNLYKKVFLISIIILITFFVVRLFLPEDIYKRLFDFSTYASGSNRDIIWINSLDLFLNGNILIGSGWGAYYGYQGLELVTHNTFISMLIDVGLIGFSLFFVPIVYSSYYLFRRKNFLPIYLIINILVVSFFLETINKRFFWIPIILIFLEYNREKQKQLVLNE